MPARTNDYRRSIQSALRNEQAVWSPQCPEPETLLDWIEQEEAHPQAALLLQHLTSCAYCRREVADLREIRALVRETPPQTAAAPQEPVGAALPEAGRISLADVVSLPAKVGAWARKLVTEGITAPIRSVRTALEQLDRLTASVTPALTRGEETPTALHPAGTAVRSLQPTLRWSAVETAQEYIVVVARQLGRNRRESVWQGSVHSALQLTLPEQAGLEPGGFYFWQVIARTEGEEFPSRSVGFAILAEQTAQQLEALETEVGSSTLGLIGLYEAYGLYEEALAQVEALIRLNPNDEAALAIRAKLLQRLATE